MSNLITDKCIAVHNQGFTRDVRDMPHWYTEETFMATAPEFLWYATRVSSEEQRFVGYDPHGRMVSVEELRKLVGLALGIK